MTNHESPDIGKHDIAGNREETEHGEKRQVRKEEDQRENDHWLRAIAVRECIKEQRNAARTHICGKPGWCD